MSINGNSPIPDNILNSSYKTQFGLPLQSSKPPLRKLKKSKSISDVCFTNFIFKFLKYFQLFSDLKNSLNITVDRKCYLSVIFSSGFLI